MENTLHKTIFKPLNTSKRVLMGPGPSDVNPRVLHAMSTPLIGHLDPEFVDLMDNIKEMVRETFLTRNDMSFVISAPGSAGMEASLVNLLEPGDEAIICIHGAFGNRMADIAQRCGAKVVKVESDWGKPIDPNAVKKALESCSPKLLAIVHAETSTGVLQPLQEISKLVHDAGALFVVDAVTSYCGTELRVDEWDIDAIYTGTQKCLSAPPGLSPVSFSDRALEVIDRRKTKVQSWFLDISLVRNYWTGSNRTYHHTAPVSSIYALYEAYRIVLEEGLEKRWQRHQANHNLLKQELEGMGFEFLVEEPYRLPMLNAVVVPEDLNEAEIRSRLLSEFDIEIGAGLGQLAGKIWRIGIMGESSTPEHIDKLVSALKILTR